MMFKGSQLTNKTQCQTVCPSLLIIFYLQVRNFSLPIQRELADIKICCGELMLEMFQVHSKEIRNIQLNDMRKGSVVKVRYR